MKPFRFKEFTVNQDKAAMKVGTDAVMLGAWCHIGNEVETILDVGAGTGVLSLMLAQRSEAMAIDAVELEVNAFEQCVDNFEQSNWGDRLFCYHSSFQGFAKEMKEEGEEYDLVISNPPFYNGSYKSINKERNKARFIESLSFLELISGVVDVLSENGVFVVVVPFIVKDEFEKMALGKGLFLSRVCDVQGSVCSKVVRSLMEFSFEETIVRRENMVIEKERNEYTSEYLKLVSDFYLNC